jgi:hypothetical protein
VGCGVSPHITLADSGFNVSTRSTIVWPAVAAGFLAVGGGLAAIVTDIFGEQTGRGVREIGAVGWIGVSVGFLAAIGGLVQFVVVSAGVVVDAVSGGLLAVLVYVLCVIVWAGEVSGWTAPREYPD